MYRKEEPVLKRGVERAARIIELQSLEKEFQDFGEIASEFVKRVSVEGGMTYRGERGAVEANLNVTKKVFSKWSIEILMTAYSLKSVGFGDFRRVLQGISSRVLSQKLKDMEELGFIRRNVAEARPPKVRYTLTKEGEMLAKLGEPVIIYLRQAVK